MLMLKPPALKRQGYKYHEPFEFEWQYYYKEHMSYNDFLNTTGEGKVIQDSMKRDGYTVNLERFYDNLANKLDKEYKAEQRKAVNKIIKEVEAEQRKLGNWINYYEDFYQVYENNELVYQDSWWKGKHTMFKKEGFEESSVNKAINERMEKEGYELTLKGWVKK
jgi:hypothetical protein